MKELGTTRWAGYLMAISGGLLWAIGGAVGQYLFQTNTINTNIKRVKFALFAVSLVLLFIAIVLISHTIRLSVYSKRFIVRSMQLVGATEGFIMKPFLKTFMKQGLIAAFIALICMTFTLIGIKQYLPEADLFQNDMHIFKIYFSIIGISLILTMCSTFFSRCLTTDV